MKTNKIVIRQEGATCELTIDGVSIKGLQSVTYRNRLHEVPYLGFELFSDDLDIECFYIEEDLDG